MVGPTGINEELDNMANTISSRFSNKLATVKRALSLTELVKIVKKSQKENIIESNKGNFKRKKNFSIHSNICIQRNSILDIKNAKNR